MKRIVTLFVFALGAAGMSMVCAAPAPAQIATPSPTATPASARGRRGPTPHPTATDTNIDTRTLIADLMTSASADGMIHVIFETEKGNIEMALDFQHAPITCDGFLKYVDAGHYPGGTFFRTTSRAPGSSRGIVIIQAEIDAQRERQNKFPPFVLETTTQTGITHTTTTLSMPRWSEPHSATSGLSIMVGESHSLDADPPRGRLGYATFGHVVGGWDVVRAIHDSPAEGDTLDKRLSPPIRILRAYRTMAAGK
jgi:peptidyl-prolyl cis-trans isomerase A (cyclophilin A)